MREPASLAIEPFLPYMRYAIRCEQSQRESNLMSRMKVQRFISYRNAAEPTGEPA